MNHRFQLNDKVVLITGGTGVLGSEMVKGLLEAEAHVVVLGRTKEKLNQMKAAYNKKGQHIDTLLADVTDKKSLEQAYEEFKQQHTTLDVLINAAGGNLPGATILPEQDFTDLSESDLKQVVNLNYHGTVLTTQVFIQSMVENGRGHIINISSMAADTPLTRVLGYSSAKAAINNYTKWLAVELPTKYGEHFRVNAIAPGFFLTEQNRELLTNEDGSLTDRGKTIVSHTPFKRFGKPEELTGTVIWLCSDASAFVNGTIIEVDGGFNAFSGV